MSHVGVQLDLGVSGVHQPGTIGGDGGAPATTKPKTYDAAAQRRAKRAEVKKAKAEKRDAKAKLRKRSIKVSADLAPGGSLHVRHMSLRTYPDSAPILLSDAGEGDAPDAVWIQLAKQGTFAGHPSGKTFKLDATIFGQIVTNFRANLDGRLPIDFEHACEQDPTSGSVPMTGSPAQGWIVDMTIRPDGNLWAKVEWGTLARQYIRGGQYRYISPAIHFQMKDRQSGKQIGAYISSAGLTNQPFLDGMQPLAARLTPGSGEVPEDETTTLAGKVPGSFLEQTLKQPHEYMPGIRACLGLGNVSTHAECSHQVERLRVACSMADPATGMHEGVDLRVTYLNGMAEAAGLSATASMGDILDEVQDMIDTASERAAQLTNRTPAEPPAPETTTTTTTTTEDTPMATPTEAEVTALTNRATKAEGDVVTLTTKLGKLPELEGEVGKLTLKATTLGKVVDDVIALFKSSGVAFMADETVDAVVKRILEQNKVLLTAKTERDEADVLADVDRVFEQYGPTGLKKLEETAKPALLTQRRESPKSFQSLYPLMKATEFADAIRLLSTATPHAPPRKKVTIDPNDPTMMSHSGLTAHLMTKEKLDYNSASDKASEMIRARDTATPQAAQ